MELERAVIAENPAPKVENKPEIKRPANKEVKQPEITLNV